MLTRILVPVHGGKKFFFRQRNKSQGLCVADDPEGTKKQKL